MHGVLAGLRNGANQRVSSPGRKTSVVSEGADEGRGERRAKEADGGRRGEEGDGWGANAVAGPAGPKPFTDPLPIAEIDGSEGLGQFSSALASLRSSSPTTTKISCASIVV